MVVHIEREIHDFVVLTRIHGEFDLDGLDQVRRAFATALALSTPPFPMVVDLDGVTFLTSIGLNELIMIDRQARERGIDLRIVATRRQVLRPMQITKLLEVLDVRSSVQDALSTAVPAERR
ncbi:STAS domain-containing protein [Actinophytocola sediminis]